MIRDGGRGMRVHDLGSRVSGLGLGLTRNPKVANHTVENRYVVGHLGVFSSGFLSVFGFQDLGIEDSGVGCMRNPVMPPRSRQPQLVASGFPVWDSFRYSCFRIWGLRGFECGVYEESTIALEIASLPAEHRQVVGRLLTFDTKPLTRNPQPSALNSKPSQIFGPGFVSVFRFLNLGIRVQGVRGIRDSPRGCQLPGGASPGSRSPRGFRFGFRFGLQVQGFSSIYLSIYLSISMSIYLSIYSGIGCTRNPRSPRDHQPPGGASPGRRSPRGFRLMVRFGLWVSGFWGRGCGCRLLSQSNQGLRVKKKKKAKKFGCGAYEVFTIALEVAGLPAEHR